MSAAIPVAQIKTITMSIYRYDPTVDKKPYMQDIVVEIPTDCLLYTSPSPRDYAASRMPSSA